jgi:glucose/arabinose dehydrogenase
MGLGKIIRGMSLPVVCFLFSACVNQESDTAPVAVREIGNETGSTDSVMWAKTLVGGLHQPWGMDFYVGDKYPSWQNSLLVCGLRSSQISRVMLTDGGVEKKTNLHMNMRVRDLQVGPDGLLYALADGSRLVRLEDESP